MSKERQKGTSWETAIEKLLNSVGLKAHRRALSGALDKGDLYIEGLPVIIEAKNERSYKLAEWIDETETERLNADASHGVVWAHRKGKSKPEDGYVIMSGSQFVAFLLRWDRELFRQTDILEE